MTDTVRVIGAIVVSVALLAAGLYVLLSRAYDADLKKWAAGWVGAVAGYWFR